MPGGVMSVESGDVGREVRGVDPADDIVASLLPGVERLLIKCFLKEGGVDVGIHMSVDFSVKLYKEKSRYGARKPKIGRAHV